VTSAAGVLRCHNCGLEGHRTQHCAKYGPRYPAPGKTSQDYSDEAQRIANLFAADIIREHEGHSHDGYEFVDDASSLMETRQQPKQRKRAEVEVLARKHTCPMCGSEPELTCRTRDGLRTQAHRARRDLITTGAEDVKA
jgi:predicted RNA-binding Zn-ribbon protein involved in translation (DUF1610 family)